MFPTAARAKSGDPLPSRTARAPKLSDDELQRRLADAAPVAERYHIENLPPEGS